MEILKIANVAYAGRGAKSGRAGRLLDYLEARRPDVVTVQKAGDTFPSAAALRRVGYASKRTRTIDERTDPGVAILTRNGMPKPEVLRLKLPGVEGKESRFLMVRIGRLLVASAYAPYGGGLSKWDAIAQRVACLDLLRAHLFKAGCHDGDSVIGGDFNAKLDAPAAVREGLDPDQAYGNKYSEREVRALNDCGFCDLYRKAHTDATLKPGNTHRYDVRPGGTSRLHMILASPGLLSRWCLRDARLDCDAPRPRADAPPLVVELRHR